MRTNLDFSHFYRSSIGFDRLFDLLENAGHLQNGDGWPPYDIAKLGENTYRITVAVAGFAEGDLSVMQEGNLLVVEGTKAEDGKVQYLHHGLALRPFTRRFELADHVSVTGAQLQNGLLVVDLKRDLPEEMKPRRIAIASETGRKPAVRRIDAAAA